MANSVATRQRRVLALVQRYQRLLGLERWQIHVMFEADEDGAACSADDEYLRADICFDLTKIDEANEAGTVRHELLHCLTWEMLRVAEHLAKRDRVALEMVRAASERTVTLLERMPIWDAP